MADAAREVYNICFPYAERNAMKMEEQNYNMIDNVLNNCVEKLQREANKKEQEHEVHKHAHF